VSEAREQSMNQISKAPGSAAALSQSSEVDDVIRLEHIYKSFDGTAVIEDLNLSVRRGEFLTLLGPSGCGKTTTLQMIAGFETPDSGRILLDGVDVSGLPPYKRNLNTVFQQYALFPHMTVFDNVAFGPRTHGVDRATVKQRVDAALEKIGMSAHARKKPGQLSGGQQQRVALARALVNMPSALLLDEPLSALDVKLRRAMQLELKRIQAEVHTTFIFVTHDQEEALTMSSRIAVMNGGQIEQLDTPEVLYTRPATPFVASFIGQATLLPGVVRAVGDGLATLELEGGGSAPAAAPARIGIGQKVLLMLRPEQVRLGPPSEESTHGFTARLETEDFQGVAFRYGLRRADGREVVATLLPQYRLRDVSPGDMVGVDWDPAQAWVVPGYFKQSEGKSK